MNNTTPLYKRRLMVAAGVLCLLLGAVGMVVPVLPTTPFLLLAAALFLRSSTRLYRWLTTHRVFGPFILNYRRHHAVPRSTKVVGIVFLWLTIGISVIWAVQAWWLRALLLCVAVGVTIHLARLKTLTPAMQAESAAAEDAVTLPADPAVE
jgi:uncharacterized membrane protein YbaN (DUF454 family)